MLVDDKYDVLQGIANGVNWNEIGDIKLFFASSGIEALEIIEHQAIQLLITDIEMPGISGLDLAEKLHREKKDIATVFLTSHDSFRYAQTAIRIGCCDYILQPVDYEKLQEAIIRVTDSNLNHTGIYLYSKGKIMIHLTFDYKTDEKCTTPGQYLKYHRTFQGLSTRELAEKVGIVPATLVLYENDRHPIKHSTAVALANALGIDRNRLLDKYTAFVDYPYSSLLKKVRQDLSLTQIQMAELIGIGQTSYSGWEREIRVPRRKEYDKILAALEKLRVNVDTYLCQSASI